MSESKGSSGGVTFPGMLLLAFIVLKLCGVIAWSWWWVTSPVWIIVLICTVVVVLGAMAGAKQ